jgi:hypothetical protein
MIEKNGQAARASRTFALAFLLVRWGSAAPSTAILATIALVVSAWTSHLHPNSSSTFFLTQNQVLIDHSTQATMMAANHAPPNHHNQIPMTYRYPGPLPVQERPPSPDELFLTSLRQCIEGHFNPEHVMHNDVLQSVLNCYQGYYPLQFLLVNPIFESYIAHCYAEDLPVVPSFLRALEHSRTICVTGDNLFIYLADAPSGPPSTHQQQQPQVQHTPHMAQSMMHSAGPRSFLQVASGSRAQSPQVGFYGVVAAGNQGTSMPGPNVPELTYINNDKPPPMTNAHTQFMNHHPHHDQYASESPTSVFEVLPDHQGQGMMENQNHNRDECQTRFVQHGPPTMFYASSSNAPSMPRPTYAYATSGPSNVTQSLSALATASPSLGAPLAAGNMMGPSQQTTTTLAYSPITQADTRPVVCTVSVLKDDATDPLGQPSKKNGRRQHYMKNKKQQQRLAKMQAKLVEDAVETPGTILSKKTATVEQGLAVAPLAQSKNIEPKK